jgi:hypothetical protein
MKEKQTKSIGFSMLLAGSMWNLRPYTRLLLTFVGIVHFWFYSSSNNRHVAWRHMPACVYACAKWLDWYILTQDTPRTFTCGKFWQTRENCYTMPTFSNLLLLQGGIAQSVPYTVTTSDLLRVPIWVLNIPDLSIGSNQQKRLVAKQQKVCEQYPWILPTKYPFSYS